MVVVGVVIVLLWWFGCCGLVGYSVAWFGWFDCRLGLVWRFVFGWLMALCFRMRLRVWAVGGCGWLVFAIVSVVVVGLMWVGL